MKILEVSKNQNIRDIGVEIENTKFPPRCPKCGGYVIVQDVGSLLYSCPECGDIGEVISIEADNSYIENIVRLRRGKIND